MRRRHFFLSCAPLALTAPDDAGEALWRDYVAWYRTRPDTDFNPRLSYLAELRRRGLSPGEVERRGRILESLAAQRRAELEPYFFDRTYRSSEPRFNAQPNSFLAQAVRGRKPGAALDIHMGQGRNAIFLAQQGWQVSGFDFSAEGVARAEAAARTAGVRIQATVCRHQEFGFAPSQWDLIVMTYAWIPLREPILQRIIRSLRPGGILLFEQMLETSGGEHAAPWLPRRQEVLKLFAALKTLQHEELTARPDWSWRPEPLVRYLGEMPAG
ncbi:MAG: class I SAM-dependent methyltransferase [Acidobacteria bacterium]|nr:class I SAM-dependent methyltransferase [Acidobacteriota bacterium]